MTKDKLKASLQNEAAKLKEGEKIKSFVATSAIYHGNIPFAANEEEFANVDWKTKYRAGRTGKYIVPKVPVVMERVKDYGYITLTIQNGLQTGIFLPVYSINQFVEEYGE